MTFVTVSTTTATWRGWACGSVGLGHAAGDVHEKDDALGRHGHAGETVLGLDLNLVELVGELGVLALEVDDHGPVGAGAGGLGFEVGDGLAGDGEVLGDFAASVLADSRSALAFSFAAWRWRDHRVLGLLQAGELVLEFADVALQAGGTSLRVRYARRSGRR